MKKLSLLLVLVSAAVAAKAQRPAFIVNSPSAVAGVNLNIGVGAAGFGPAVDATLTPVTGNLVLAYDSTATGAAVTLGCGAVSNVAATTGNISLIDRGTCNFTLKVDNAEAAGAIAVVICNNQPSGVLASFGGASAATIPVIMIDKPLCDAIKVEMANGPVNVTIDGDYRYGQDIQCTTSDVAMSPYAALPVSEVTGPNDANVYLAINPVNVGTQDINGSTVTLDISFGGASVYSETATPPAVFPSGDSAFVSFNGTNLDGIFQPTANVVGDYTITYTAVNATDEYAANNSNQQVLQVTNNVMSKVPVDGTGLPLNESGLRRGGTATATEWGNLFHINYGTGYEIRKAHFGVAFSAIAQLAGKGAAFNIRTWDDANADGVIDRATELSDPVAYAEHVFTSAETLPTNRLITLTEDVYNAADNTIGFPLTDNAYYVATIVVQHADSAFVGTTEVRDYTLLSRLNNTDFVYYPSVIVDDAQIFSGFTDDHSQPALSFEITEIDTKVNEANAGVNFKLFPNPTSDVLNVQMNLASRANYANIEVVSMTGQTLMAQRIEGAQNGTFQVNTSNLAAGLYVVKITTEKGFESKTFSVAK